MKITCTKQKRNALEKKNVTLVTFVADQKEHQIFRNKSGKVLIEVAVGKPGRPITLRHIKRSMRQLVRSAKSNLTEEIAFSFTELHALVPETSKQELAELVTINMLVADYEFLKYKTERDPNVIQLKQVFVLDTDAKAKEGIKRGTIIAQEVNGARDWCNTAGSELHPEQFLQATKELFLNSSVKVEALSKKKMEQLQMGGLLAVSQGSKHNPEFILMKYNGGKKGEAPIVLVGKGVTYDTGGFSLKPSPAMVGMHLDMSGAACVVHAVSAIAKLGIKKNVIGVAAVAENMLSPDSYKPSDVVKMMSGKTVEVLNTDAEGRIILADSLTYIKKFNPQLVIDVATLTGAAISALGRKASAFFATDEDLEHAARKVSEQSGDYLWPLPLWEEYNDEVIGTYGDLSNIQNHGRNREGGCIIGATFLNQFVDGDYPWIHIDIAPRMVASDHDDLAQGSTGEPVNFLVQMTDKY